MNTTQSLKPDEMSDRQFLGWNVQVRQQLVEDLYYTCRQNGEILEELLDEYVYLLKDDGKLYVPMLDKSFNRLGKEVDNSIVLKEDIV